MTPLETAIAAVRDALTGHTTNQASLATAQAALAPIQARAAESAQKLNAAIDCLVVTANAAKIPV